MSTLYNEYLTGTDREIAIIFAEYSAQIAKLDVLFEAVDATLKANMLAAEAKVFAESGTYDDLTMLYTEAQADAEEKKVGIIRSIINAITNFFKNIKAKLVGQPVATPDATVELDGETGGKLNLFSQSWANIQSGVNKIKSAGFFAGADDLLKGLAPWVGTGAVAVTAATVTLKHKEIQTKIDELAEKSSTVQSILNVITDFLNMFKKNDKPATDTNKDAGNTNTQTNATEGSDGEKLNIGNKVTSAIKKFTDWVAGLMGKLRSFITGGKAANTDDTKPAEAEEPKKDDNNSENTDDENKYVKNTKDLSKDEKKAAHEAAKKSSGKKHLSKDEKAAAEEDAKKAKTKASNDRVRSAISTWDEKDEFNESTSETAFDSDEFFSESTMTDEEFEHAMRAAIINHIDDKNLALALIEESMFDDTDEDDDDIVTEGTHRDIAKKYRKDVKEFRQLSREIKKHIKHQDFVKAAANVAAAKIMLKSGKASVMRDIKSVDDYDFVSTAFGQIFNMICNFCRNFLLILFVCPVGAVKQMIEELQDIIKMIQNIIDKLRNGDKLTIKDFDTYFVHVERSYDRLIGVVDRFSNKIRDLSKDAVKDGIKKLAKESTSDIDEVLNTDDIFSESDMSDDDYNELCALFADL